MTASRLAKQVDYHHSTLSILSHVNLTVSKGESVAIVGNSGSGKSTLLTLLAGLDTATSGEIALFGQPLTTLSEDQRAQLRLKRVGFVFQNFQLMPQLTALENVMLPLELAGHDHPQAPARDMLNKVGLEERLKHYPRHLSGGEQQRVALARAFVSQPAILFADEPTGNLDPKTGQQITELLFQLNNQQQTALILVTHDPALAARCHTCYRLQNGTLIKENQ